jgi:Na+/H+-dicarboxylate symporter
MSSAASSSKTFVQKISKLALNPYVVTLSILSGGLLGYFIPEIGKRIGFMGSVYVDLMKVIVLPFMLSAVVFSIRSLLTKSGDVGSLIKRVLFVYVAAYLVVAILGIVSALTVQPGAGLDEATLQAFGNLIQSDKTVSTDLEISLSEPPAVKKTTSFSDTIVQLIPSNIFSALSGGETLKVLVFALLFGFAMGRIPQDLSEIFTRSLQSVYLACQKLTQWFNLLLPIASFSMAAEQIALTGVGPLQIMLKFLGTFSLATVLVLVISFLLIWARSHLNIFQVLSANRDSFFMALATRNSSACMPVMIESLVAKLRLNRAETELLVPLGIALLRIGPVVYYTIAVIFIAELYGRDLHFADILLIFGISILAGIASTGMTSIVAVAQTSVVCTYLGLPFEAAFILFIAVDPVADMLRTAMLVIGINAVTVLIANKPERPQPHHHQHFNSEVLQESLEAGRHNEPHHEDKNRVLVHSNAH